jgi:hypothetical protein
MKDYHTKTEALHIKLLENMGFTVINPSGPRYEKKVKNLKAEGKTSSEIMDYFVEVVKNCDHLAFSTTKDGKVSAGVMKEIETMKEEGGSIVQLPDLNSLESMNISDTRKHIREPA